MSDELLKQILEEIKSMKTSLQDTRSQMNSMETSLQDTRAQMNSRFDTLEIKLSNVEVDTSSIKESMARIEENEPEDVIGTLRHLEKELNEQQDLLEKVEELEIDIILIKKAITNQ